MTTDYDEFMKRIKQTREELVRLQSHAKSQEPTWVDPLTDAIDIIDASVPKPATT